MESSTIFIYLILNSCIWQDEIRANTEDWEALGMHGNMSGPLIVEGIFNKERMVGPEGDGRRVRMTTYSNQVLSDFLCDIHATRC